MAPRGEPFGLASTDEDERRALGLYGTPPALDPRIPFPQDPRLFATAGSGAS